MKKLLLSILLCFGLHAVAQVSTGDCSGAIVLCGDLYTEESAPPGTGFEYEYTGVCNQNLETMSLWYTWTVYSPGQLSFILTPNDPADDYDWGLFNITNGGCDGIAPGGSSPEVSCNSWGSFSPPNGPTGISSANGGVSNSGGPGNLNGPPFNANLNVTTGQTYALVVMNWSNSQSGYTIDFSESTASLYDQVPPQPISLTTDCTHSQFVVTFSEVVQTSSADNLDFLLTGPQGQIGINNLLPLNPQATLEDQYVIFPTSIITEPGIYTLTITDLSGSVIDPCGNTTLGSVSIDLDVPMSFQVNAIDACNGVGGEIIVSDITGVTGDYSILLNGNLQDDLIFENLSPGSYGVMMTDQSSCVALQQINVLNHQITVDIPIQDSLSCEDPSLQVVGVNVLPAQNATFQWYNITSGFTDLNQDVIDPTVTSSGTYLLVATTEDGFCSASDTLVVVASELTDLAFDYVATIACNGVNGSLEFVNVSGGTSPYQYFIDDQPSDTNIDALDSGVYELQVVDELGCTVAVIAEVPTHDMSLSINDVADLTCFHPSYTLDEIFVTPLQSISYAYYINDNGTWVSIGSDDAQLFIDAVGTYALTVTNPETGCSLSQEFVVGTQIPDNFSFTVDISTACNGSGGSMEISNVEDGVPPYQLYINSVWQSDLLIENLTPGNLDVMLMDSLGCYAEQTIVIPNATLSVSYNIPQSLSCVVDETVLSMPVINPNQTVSYEWFMVEQGNVWTPITFNGPTPTINEPGVYGVIVTSLVSGCTTTDIVDVMYDETSPITLEFSTETACNGVGGTVQILASGGEEPYAYSLNNTVQSDPFFENLSGGNVSIMVVDDEGCTAQGVVNVPNHLIDVTIPVQDRISCEDPNIQIEGVVVMPPQSVNYTWNYLGEQGWQSTGQSTIDPLFNQIGIYSLTVTNPTNGCEASAEVNLDPGEIVAVDLNKLIFPNVVTVNGDSKNDQWRPFFGHDPSFEVMSVMHTYHLLVFNRWGQLVHESDESENGRWIIDDQIADGNYFYVMEYSTYCGGFQTGKKEGWITVMR
ncbi:MAG: gliding motility-associated C-terminal domain-containing protein [Flavobacteriales bacterium]|nr:gliding motility-associated C-terminal domain-containing protein [Flavobacteriales bacterium]